MMESNDIELKKTEARWYALKIFTGHEDKVKATIEAEVKRLGMDDRVQNIVIPKETIFEVKNGKRKTKVQNFLSGYILVKCFLDAKLKNVITQLPSIVSFVGRRNDAVPLQQSEVDRILGRVEERRDLTTVETSFEQGDPVKVIEGPFNTFSGTVKEVNYEKQKLKVEVGILGRKTPVELDFNQVELEA
jgi:transcriptional antiterminator NusG